MADVGPFARGKSGVSGATMAGTARNGGSTLPETNQKARVARGTGNSPGLPGDLSATVVSEDVAQTNQSKPAESIPGNPAPNDTLAAGNPVPVIQTEGRPTGATGDRRGIGSPPKPSNDSIAAGNPVPKIQGGGRVTAGSDEGKATTPTTPNNTIAAGRPVPKIDAGGA